MSMDSNRLGAALLANAQDTVTETELRDRLRTELDAVIATLDESSDPDDFDTYRNAMCRAFARMVTIEFVHNEGFWNSIAVAIIDEIKENASILSLLCNQVAAGVGPHIHNVSTIANQTGKIV